MSAPDQLRHTVGSHEGVVEVISHLPEEPLPFSSPSPCHPTSLYIPEIHRC